MRKVIILGFAALVPAMAFADAVVKVHSDQPAKAYIDGALAGATPLQIAHLKPGNHVLKVSNLQTGEFKLFDVESPADRHAVKELVVGWGNSAGTVLPNGAIATPLEPQSGALPQQAAVSPTYTVAQPSGVAQSSGVVVQPVYTTGAPVVYANGAYGYGYARPYQNSQPGITDKSLDRTLLLGAAVANEALNTGNSKNTIRDVTLGGALLNELRPGR